MKANLLFATFLLFYHFLFWQEGIGLNLALFSVLVLAWQKRKSLTTFSKREWLYLIPFCSSLIGVLWVNTVVSILVLLLSTFAYAGYLANEQSSALENFFSGLRSFFSLRMPLLPQPLIKQGSRRPIGILYMRIAFIPLVLFAIFFALFSAGNPIFRSWSNNAFGRFFALFDEVSPIYLLFILLGLVVCRWIFMRHRKTLFELAPHNFLSRKPGLRSKRFKTLSLKHEYWTALAIFASLNLLLAVVNFIDVKWVWFQFYVPNQFSLKEFVHEGVGWLVVSLLLSAALVFYFFRQNLNYYPHNRILRAMAQLWIFQNLILTISVALRSFYYIGFHGLANGRITVLVFLSIVAFALVMLMLKVQQKRNAAFTIRWVSAYSLILFGACSLVNWDAMIARVNLAHGQANEIDVDNYLNLNPQVYPYVYDHLDRVEFQIKRHNTNDTRWISYDNVADFKRALDKRAESYLEERAEYSWASWNPADGEAVEKLNKISGQ